MHIISCEQQGAQNMTQQQENQTSATNEWKIPDPTRHPQYKRITEVRFERYGPTTVAFVTLVNTRNKFTEVMGTATRRGNDKEFPHIGKLVAIQKALDKEQERVEKQRKKFGLLL